MKGQERAIVAYIKGPIKGERTAVINISDLPLLIDCVSDLFKGVSFSTTYLGNEFYTKVFLCRFYCSLHFKVCHHQRPGNVTAQLNSDLSLVSIPNPPLYPSTQIMH